MLWKLVLVVAAVLMALAAANAPARSSDPVELTVHEWGTFTSVAGVDGKAVEWLPQSGPPDLPSFVERVGSFTKGCLSGTVRMETPVLYFYAPAEMSVDVTVRFPSGVVTEWYPRADVSPRFVSDSSLRSSGFIGTAAWANVRVLPGAVESFPVDRSASHYYAARQTEAAALQVGRQSEKFLFYRGVARFEPPLSARVAADGTIRIDAHAGEAIGDIILFENRGGRIGHTTRRTAAAHAAVAPPALDRDAASLRLELERLLVAHGLYPDEARAMVATWRDSWFEEGTRLFYVLPQTAVDGILPLEIHPPPAAIARVFVGRIEIVTPATRQAVAAAISGYDDVTLARYGRFLRPIADRLLAERPVWARPALERQLGAAYARLSSAGCR